LPLLPKLVHLVFVQQQLVLLQSALSCLQLVLQLLLYELAGGLCYLSASAAEPASVLQCILHCCLAFQTALIQIRQSP
jgi:hypothetical protein